jgi:hypothetical protein
LPIWLINRSRDDLIVEASGGAGTVVVDTVPGLDSALVRLETRASQVSLTGLAMDGGRVGEAVIPVTRDTVRIAFPR